MIVPKRRNIWFFTCSGCGFNRRQATKKAIALAGVCRKCRRQKVPTNQIPLFEEPKVIVDVYRFGVLEEGNKEMTVTEYKSFVNSDDCYLEVV